MITLHIDMFVCRRVWPERLEVDVRIILQGFVLNIQSLNATKEANLILTHEVPRTEDSRRHIIKPRLGHMTVLDVLCEVLAKVPLTHS